MLRLSNDLVEKHHDRRIDGLFIEVVIEDDSIYVNFYMIVIKHTLYYAHSNVRLLDEPTKLLNRHVI